MLRAHLLVVAAIVCLAAARWHRDKVNRLREQYLQQHGGIDIPEALYFDSMAVHVIAAKTVIEAKQFLD